MGRLLITGASGNLGRPLSAMAVVHGWETAGTFFRHPLIGGGEAIQLDLCQRDATIRTIREWQPDVIIHTAGSERSEDMAATIQATAAYVAEAAKRSGSRLIALSTDMVFDGKRPPYDEYDPPTPHNLYGRVKAENEQMFLSSHNNCLIVRTSLIYDLAPYNRQLSWMLETIDKGEPVTLFVDEIRQPIWSWNLAKVLLELACSNEVGILNVAGPKPVSRWELGCAVLGALGYSPKAVVRPTSVAKVAPNRPSNLVLRLERARRLLATHLLPHEEALRLALAGNYS